MRNKSVVSLMAVIALCSCQREVLREKTSVAEGKAFTAVIEDELSNAKTSIDAKGNVLWKKGDQISIFDGVTINKQYQVSDSSDGKTSADFTLVPPSGFVGGIEMDDNVAFYPYQSTATIVKDEDGYVLQDIVLPSKQIYSEGSFGNGAFPMVAVTTSTSDMFLRFKNVLGALKLQLKGTASVVSVSIKGNNNEILCGDARITASNVIIPSIELTEASARTVTLDCGAGVALNSETATSFVIALPPMTMTGGFTVVVSDSEGKEMEIKTTKEQTITRSSILKMPEVTYEGKDPFTTRPLPAAVANTNPKTMVRTEQQTTTLNTLTRVDEKGELYRMDYTADYGLNALIAAGGVKSNTELLGYVQKYLLNVPSKSMMMANDFGCSSFLVKGRDNHVLFCRNFDYVFQSPVNVITRTKGTIGTFSMNMAISSTKSGTPDNGATDVSFYVAAPLAMVDGMNEYGVAISVLVVKSYGAEQHDGTKANLTTTAMIREILDNARSVDEALDLFDSYNFYAHGGSWQSNYHFFLADSTGRSVVVEYVNSGRDNKEDKNYNKVVTDSKYVTNNFLYSSFREPLSDTWREALIASRISEVYGKKDAFQLLLDVSQIYDPDLGRSVKPGETPGANSFPETLWTVVYDLTDLKAYYITGREHMNGLDPFEVPMLK